MEGLAQQMAAQPAPQEAGMPTIEQLIQMLMQGVDPEKLVAQGIPPELIMQAIQVIEQQMAAQQTPADQQGLASKSVMGM